MAARLKIAGADLYARFGGEAGWASVEIADTLRFLVGTWDLHRLITDHRTGTSGALTGIATVTPDGVRPDRARCQEGGVLSFGNHTGPASRCLEYARTSGSAVMIYFADGRPFVDLDLSNGQWRSGHDCRDDHYQLTTTVRSPDVVEERWRVRGPTKSYDAVTTLIRRPDGLGGRPQVG